MRMGFLSELSRAGECATIYSLLMKQLITACITNELVLNRQSMEEDFFQVYRGHFK